MSELVLWVWRNGPGQFVAYDDEYPRYDNGDPKTLGEPIGIAVLQPYKKSPVSVAAFNKLLARL